ncbi:hypothetical protein V5S96_02645 [Corynebacterium mastitidis]|uniref:Uncharacterized protein n=1 Tax=Corynebacterium mastitidis TaxID=161890 RepID=A0ABU8NYD0_9CORY
MNKKVVAVVVVPGVFLMCSCRATQEAPWADDVPPEDIKKMNLQAIVDHAVRRYGGAAGIAYSDGSASFGAGDMEPRPAWGTMQVPRAVAAGQRGVPVRQEFVWSAEGDEHLGGVTPEEVVDVLVQGSAGASFNPDVSHTEWTPTGQAIFAAHLPCLAHAGQVVDLMAQGGSSHGHGLDLLPHARVAEGAGLDEAGTYRIRQFGLVAGPRGDVALALTAAPESGGEHDAFGMASALAEGVRDQLGSFPTATCR